MSATAQLIVTPGEVRVYQEVSEDQAPTMTRVEQVLFETEVPNGWVGLLHAIAEYLEANPTFALADLSTWSDTGREACIGATLYGRVR